jgi:DNA-binding CsgD family transcriptional regulator
LNKALEDVLQKRTDGREHHEELRAKMNPPHLKFKDSTDRLSLAPRDQNQRPELAFPLENSLDISRILELAGNVAETPFDDLIEQVKTRFELKNIVYLCPSFPGRSLSHPYQLLTYSEDWINHYKSNRYEMIDPVIKLGSRSLLPLDWAKLPRKNPRVQKLFGESQDFGVGKQGITVPLRGPVNGIWGLFTATSDDTDGEWKQRHYELLRDLVHIAYYIHQRAYEMHIKNENIDLNTITRRESEALSWSAEGKSIEDISVLMAISAETVKAHLDSARHKLGALNRVHAVAKAIRAGLIR